MAAPWHLIFVILAALLFLLAAANVGHPRVNMIAAGLFFWVVSILVSR